MISCNHTLLVKAVLGRVRKPLHIHHILHGQSATRFATPLRPIEGTTDVDQRTTNHAGEGVEAGSDTKDDAEATFLGSSRVTSMASIVTTFLVNEELIPINIEKILGNYRLFNLVFIICFEYTDNFFYVD